FHIREINPGHYDVKIEFMGFKAYEIEEVELSMRGERSKNLGQITLSSVFIQLDVVNVIEDKPIFEFEADKMIYNSSDDIVAGSGTAEDVLNKVPMVTVDSDGEISLRGNPNVKILINGRPNRSGGDVDNIPASLIEKVEIITSPSAKYDPEGMAGIINIVLEKGRFEGLNGNLKLYLKHNKFNSIKDMNGLTLYSNYQTDKYNLYSSYSINNRMRAQQGYRRVYNTYVENEDIVYSYDYDFESLSDRFGQSLTIGSDYSLTENITLNVEGVYKNHYKEKTNTQEYLWDGLTNYLVENRKIVESSEGEDEGNYHAEVFGEVIQSFDVPDKEISISFAYDNGVDSEYETQGDNTTHVEEIEGSYEIDFTYKLPLTEKSKLEFGYDGRFNNSEEQMKFELSGKNVLDSTWTFTGTNDFDYSRSIHGFFAEYQLELNEKFSIKPSLRIEYVNKNINFNILDTVSTGIVNSIYAELLQDPTASGKSIKIDDEINYFPDLHFTYNLNNKKSIQFGLSKRIERPGGGGHGKGWGQLRPFPRSVYNDSFIMVGFPTLKPEFSTQYDLSYKSPMPMGFYYTNLYYRKIENSIEWYDYDGIDGQFSGNAVTFKNAEGGTDIGLELFMMIMGQTVGGGYNINELKDSSNDYQLNGKNERINMYMRINLPEEYIKFFSYEFGFYYMKLKVPGGTLFGAKGTLWANTGISKSLFDDMATISFSIDNIFDKGGFQMDRTKPLIDSDIEIGKEHTEILASRGGRTFSLSVKYNFGKMQEEKRRGRGKGFGGDSMDMGY
ncbi:MAG: TonB-dependent receptor, partial [Candidatus Marinimicrobia bacterium]|nr:TonB-dependent receptor [Candidatus Neomarinimicrobiota bacterium]